MTALAAVIPLHRNKKRTVSTTAEGEIPEPVQLYGLTVLAFLLHTQDDGTCTQCFENHALALMQRLIRRTASRLIVIHEAADEFKVDGA